MEKPALGRLDYGRLVETRQSRHRHLCLEFRTVLLAFRSHVSRPFQPVSLSLADCPKKRDRRRLPFVFEDKPYQLSASIGSALIPEDGSEPDTVLEVADLRMYAAKRTSKGK